MNSLFWVNLLIGCGMLLSGFKQLPVTFSWRKLAVIFSGKRESAFDLSSMLLPEAMFLAGLFLVSWAVKAGKN